MELLAIDGLKTLVDVRLLEFASLAGSNRMELNQLENEREWKRINGVMQVRETRLDRMSEGIAQRLGGANRFVAIQLNGINNDDSHDKFLTVN